jgi:glycine cleavage system H lipoate-binding protein
MNPAAWQLQQLFFPWPGTSTQTQDQVTRNPEMTPQDPTIQEWITRLEAVREEKVRRTRLEEIEALLRSAPVSSEERAGPT